MGGNEGDEQHPRMPAGTSCPPLEPITSQTGDVGIVVQGSGNAWAGVLDIRSFHFVDGGGVANRSHHVADSIHHVHRQQGSAETDRVLHAAIVQLSDGVHPMSGLDQAMPPAGNSSIVGTCVVPIAGLVHVTAGRQAGARGDTERTIAIGGVEPNPPCGQSVEMGRLDQRVTVTTQGIPIVLVRENKQEITGSLRACGVFLMSLIRRLSGKGNSSRAGAAVYPPISSSCKPADPDRSTAIPGWARNNFGTGKNPE